MPKNEDDAYVASVDEFVGDLESSSTPEKAKSYYKPKSEERKAFEAALNAYIRSEVEAKLQGRKKGKDSDSIEAQIKEIRDIEVLTNLMLFVSNRINGLKIHGKRDT